jgi:hypothetical protein
MKEIVLFATLFGKLRRNCYLQTVKILYFSVGCALIFTMFFAGFEKKFLFENRRQYG